MTRLANIVRRGYTRDENDIDGGVPFPFDFGPAYKVAADGATAVAWRVDGWSITETEDTDWTGLVKATGFVSAHMVGDDRTFEFWSGELTPIADEDYCSGCGALGCPWGC